MSTPTTHLRIGVMLEEVQLADILGNLASPYVAGTGPSNPSDLLIGGGFQFIPNVTYDTCPRDLDILIIGGTEAWRKTKVVMTTCVGSLWLTSTGLLEGRRCTTNKEFLNLAREMYPGTEWVRQRGKGELWTAGGAGAGIDMIAHYCQQRFGNEFVDTFSVQMLELNPGGKSHWLREADEWFIRWRLPQRVNQRSKFTTFL
ncbi:class I glutamine amidotransferase-like protein [Immersiella caudata]|uniref:Class I glutamine amidotransferase-like protein n=1 Tax=Immersiella caudata TaxID=314043 RepID=A0AA39XC75_9PEZI|nr:class I glutamine amidotransferase-like protein [Immersiella caudata]